MPKPFTPPRGRGAGWLARVHYQAPATDLVGITDSLETTTTRNVTLTDPIGVADALIITADWVRAITDQIGITDSATFVAGHALALAATDPVGLVDAIEVVIGRNITPTDPVGLLDALVLAIGRTATDPVGITDSLVASLGFNPSATDPVGLTDSITTVLTAAQQHYSDTFNRANTTSGIGASSDGSGTWVDRYKSSTNYLRIVSNGVGSGTASSMAVEGFPLDMASADVDVMVTPVSGSYGSLNQIVLGVRGNATQIGTYCVIPWSGSVTIKTHTTYTIGSNGAGTGTTNRVTGSAAPTSWTAGQKWRFRAQGDVYTVARVDASNAVLATYATWTDSAVASDRAGRKVSIGLNMINTTSALYDAFTADDL